MRIIENVIDGEVFKVAVRKYFIEFWDLSEKVLESSMTLTELYAKYEHAAMINEVT